MAEGKENKISKHYRFSKRFCEIVKEQAIINGMTETDFLEQLVFKKIASEVNDRSILIYHFEELKRVYKKLDTKVEEFGLIFMDFLEFFFRTQPEIGNKGEKFMAEMDYAHEQLLSFIMAHRSKLKRSGTFLFQIFGDLLEEDDSFDSNKIEREGIVENKK